MERYDFTKNVSIGDELYIEYDTKKVRAIARKEDVFGAIQDNDGVYQPDVVKFLTVAFITEKQELMFFVEEHRQSGTIVHPKKTNVCVIPKHVAENLFTEYDQLVSPEETGLFIKKCKIKEIE
jgi:hypothetical protein